MNALAVVSDLQPLTWRLQVMPLFVLVGDVVPAVGFAVLALALLLLRLARIPDRENT